MNRYLAQRLTVAATLALLSAGNRCPSRLNRAGFAQYQADTMQPLRDRLSVEADRLAANGGRLW